MIQTKTQTATTAQIIDDAASEAAMAAFGAHGADTPHESMAYDFIRMVWEETETDVVLPDAMPSEFAHAFRRYTAAIKANHTDIASENTSQKESESLPFASDKSESMITMTNENTTNAAETKPLTLKQQTQQMLETARAKNGGNLGSKKGQEIYDPRKFRRM